MNTNESLNNSPGGKDQEKFIEELISLVETMVAESGDPDVPFNAEKWLTEWINQPLPALGGARPVEYMETPERREIITRLLASAQTGAYQ